MNLTRVWAIAHNVFRETIRDRILYVVLLYVAVLGAGMLLLPDLSLGNEDKVLLDIGLASLNALSLLVAIFVGTNLVNKEIEKRTVFVLIAKPVTRTEFIIGKHLGLVALSGTLVGLMGVILLAVATLQTDPPYLALCWAIVFIFFEIALIVGAAIMFGTFSTSILASLYTAAVYIIGHFSGTLIELRNATEGGLARAVIATFFFVVPNLERLNLKNIATYGDIPPLAELGGAIVYSISYTVLLLAIAVIVFSRRQF